MGRGIIQTLWPCFEDKGLCQGQEKELYFSLFILSSSGWIFTPSMQLVTDILGMAGQLCHEKSFEQAVKLNSIHTENHQASSKCLMRDVGEAGERLQQLRLFCLASG